MKNLIMMIVLVCLSMSFFSFNQIEKVPPTKIELEEAASQYYYYFLGSRFQCNRTHAVKNTHYKRSIKVTAELSCQKWSKPRVKSKVIGPREEDEIECAAWLYADRRFPIKYKLISVEWVN